MEGRKGQRKGSRRWRGKEDVGAKVEGWGEMREREEGREICGQNPGRHEMCVLKANEASASVSKGG